MLSIAWGILAPISIGAVYLRSNINFLKTNTRWLNIHLYLSGTVAFFTILGFILAIVATKMDDPEEQHFNDDIHHKVGLVIFILVIIQGLAGYFRPSPTNNKSTPPPISNSNNNKNDNKNNDDDDECGSSPVNSSVDSSSEGDIEKVCGGTANIAPIADSNTFNKNDKNKKNKLFTLLITIRTLWEYTHRSLGIILLALSWFNCHSGIILLSDNNYDQDDENTLLNTFWSITGCIAGSIFFIGYIIR